jgi:hypothetical protein
MPIDFLHIKHGVGWINNRIDTLKHQEMSIESHTSGKNLPLYVNFQPNFKEASKKHLAANHFFDNTDNDSLQKLEKLAYPQASLRFDRETILLPVLEFRPFAAKYLFLVALKNK